MKHTVIIAILLTIIFAGLHQTPPAFAKAAKTKKHAPVTHEDVRIRIDHLDYSCWRMQSDAAGPVFIEKKKPVKDLQIKIDRCLPDHDSHFTLTYSYPDMNEKKHTEETNVHMWKKLDKGCYTATVIGPLNNPKKIKDFVKIACN